MPSVMWFRRDLRLHDLPALAEAATAGPVLPLFVLDRGLLDHAGAVRTSCLYDALRHLHDACDGRLVVRTGPPERIVPEVARAVGASSVHVTAESEPYGRHRDTTVQAALADAEIDWVATGTPYAIGPGLLHTGGGTPYRVFTPYLRAWRDHGHPAPAPLPRSLRWADGLDSEPLPPTPDLPADLTLPTCSEDTAHERLTDFIADDLADYDTLRDRPDLHRTSGLSMHLKFGTIHPRTILAAVAAAGHTPGTDRFTAELAWREFYADVLWHRPDSLDTDLRPALSTMDYDDPDDTFDAWRTGHTGFPFVDAGMRQLRTEGWMHNRVRMVTASFLIKDLHLWWPYGARHFMAHLRDGDPASNSHGWQWTAGTGTDAAPYFRIFNPITQGQKFDPHGDYVRRYVPELAHLPGRAVHEPWKHPDGYAHGYPRPIVDHAAERAEALRRYQAATS
ncbi:Deoxyribodipyrimidine photo-lyase [Austwickia sp. TVS 96-490-7B]|uniref:cryptochrome/photolyase family protein n=1 Tax=Austwickia sp. TVS 96-490-7B TaxID=2830843 RepID=UPI001C5A42A3|nr:deoxyribodipyrimidine photo-lyase [Austwickia sp. TVS 96-490-7B]MBW3084097.1 Deoxyribodipyrimidine photo-lyase [Austwickia sp. TVS 96-490-7B]